MVNALSQHVQPSVQARDLGTRMLGMDDVMYEILDETIPTQGQTTVHESGRTVCGPGHQIMGPLQRFPTSVRLAQCPRGVRGGTWHTHVTKSQLRNPNNSLPDTANVIFGEVDVSIVAGTRTAEMVVAAHDPHAAMGEFQDALGIEVNSTDAVIDAIVEGHIPNPPEARRRVKQRLGDLFVQRNTNFHDLDQRLDSTGIPHSSPSASIDLIDAQFLSQFRGDAHDHRVEPVSKNPLRNHQGTRNWCRQTSGTVKRVVTGNGRVRPADVARSTTISVIVGRAIRGLLP